MSYFYYTGEYFRCMFDVIDDYDADTVTASVIESIYSDIVEILNHYADIFVPKRCKSFYKYWWTKELDILKDNAMQSSVVWKDAGKPRSGPIFDRYRSDKQVYRLAIRERKDDDSQAYSNDLHDMLVAKQGPSFWRVWRSKFDVKNDGVVQVDGVADKRAIADKFVKYFQGVCERPSDTASSALLAEYSSLRQEYCGDPYLRDYNFEAGLVERVICDMKRGKAAGLDNLTAEHLQHCHYSIYAVLAKLFNLIVLTGHIPSGFGYSYTVPIPKQNTNVHSKAHGVDDFRGISISPVLSKVFEYCILARYRRYFNSSDNQFSYKRKIGCSTVLYTVRCVVDHYVKNGSTVNLCALDLSKAFDRLNHHGLYIKLMKRCVPVQLLRIVENWFSICQTCVRWQEWYSGFFTLSTGTRQGGVLSPVLFNLYIDGIVSAILTSGIGCHLRNVSLAVLIYADDILLLAPTVSALQRLVDLCCMELQSLDMEINFKKSVCMRIGPKFKAECSNIVTGSGHSLNWVQHCRYLGVLIVSASVFRCNFSDRKKAFYRSFNSIYGRIGRFASAEVIVELIRTKCIPLLFYANEVLPLTSGDYKSFDYVINGAIRKTFKINSNETVDYCRAMFCLQSSKEIICARRSTFLSRLQQLDNSMCAIWAV